MNKEIKYVDEDTVLVFDEYGNYTKEPYKINMEKKLETENKIENINQVIEKVKKQISECDSFDDILDFILKLTLIIPIVSLPLLYTNAITSAVTSLIAAFAGTGVITSVIFKNYNTKNKNGLNAKLEYASNLENEYQNELNELLSKTTQISEVSKHKDFTSEVIPIKYNDGLDDSVKEVMNIVYNEAYSNNKTLILTKNKKHNKNH